MRRKRTDITRTGYLVWTLLLIAACSGAPRGIVSQTITTTTTDGVTIYGEPSFGGLDATAPLVLLFHQGGSNGRGEYAEIMPWLNSEGFRVIAWDQRSGGDLYGEANRTQMGLPEGTSAGFCDAYPDLLAALTYVAENSLADQVILWGSSYSAALVFRLAAEHQALVSGVIAFSPASGGPMVDCRARMWIDEVRAPVFVLRPASEMERESSLAQRDLLTAAGARFSVIKNGIHGSSMLVDTRTEHDMQEARVQVADWLREATRSRR